MTEADGDNQVTRADVLIRADDTAAAAGLAQLLAARYSCRAYTGEPVPRSTISRIVEIAQLTASWCNSQAWQITVTTGRGTDRFRDALFAHASAAEAPDAFDLPAPERFDGIYRERRRECGWALYESVGVQRGDRVASARQTLENFRLFGAPHVAIVTTPRDLGAYGAVDCGGFIASFLLAAQSLGVASIAQAAIASRSPFIREYFAIPDDRAVLCGISFGYAEASHPANRFRTTRARVDDVIQWVEE